MRNHRAKGVFDVINFIENHDLFFEILLKIVISNLFFFRSGIFHKFSSHLNMRIFLYK